MRKIVLASVALSGLFAATAISASAAPSPALVDQRAPERALVTSVDYDHHYEWHHHEWHHRRWEHGHWHYWD